MITDAELLELETLLAEEKIDILKAGLCTRENANPNYTFLYNCLNDQQRNKRGELMGNSVAGAILEGSSRSGKTWSSIDFIIWLCLYVETDCTILVVRETFAEFKETLYDDFKRRFNDFGLEHPFDGAQIVKQIKIGNNKIKFVGCDKVGKKHGATSDYIFFNEVMHIPEAVFNQLKMRCRKFWWCDYNPSFMDHWLFNKVQTRKDVGFLRTTFRDNPFLSGPERNEILVTEPWLPGSYEVIEGVIYHKGEIVDDDNQPPPHPENVKPGGLGTADEYYWKVYGLGLRGSMEGSIFKAIHYIKEWPSIAKTYANDFGFTNDPNALVKYAEDEKNIWFELLVYQSIDNDDKLAAVFEALGIAKNSSEDEEDGDIITCDSSDKYTGENKGTVEMVTGLNEHGYNAHKVHKTKSVMYWIGSMKKKKIHCIINDNVDFVKNEQQKYKFKKVAGIAINQPIDKDNHCFDAVRYGHIAHNTEEEEFTTDESISDMGINW